MTIAIGDIHGCHRSLVTMLDFLKLDQEDTLITLGDYVDRGPDSRAVIEILIGLKASHPNYIHLMGNHEIQMIRALEAPHHKERFLSGLCGGQDTLDSYGGRFEDVDQSHWDFINSAELYYETEKHIFVHAGLESNIDLDKQDKETYYYKRFGGNKAHKSGKPVICGHTIQGDMPTNLGHSICIDTCAYGGGWLTAYEPETGRGWQTNEAGEKREVTIG